MENKKKQIYSLSDYSINEYNLKELQNELLLEEITFSFSKTQHVLNLLQNFQFLIHSFTTVKKLSLYFGDNIFIGSNGLQMIFESLKKVQTLQDLKLKIEQGNHCGQNFGNPLIEGLNSLKQLKSLNFKLNVFNNLKLVESDCFGKSFAQLNELESLSITLYRYKGVNQLHKEILNSLRGFTNLKKLSLKIKNSFLQIIDCYDILNFEDILLPNLEEFTFSAKGNSIKTPKEEQVDKMKEILMMDQNFILKSRDQSKLMILGAFKQLNHLKQVKQLSILFDTIIPYYLTDYIFNQIQGLQKIQFSKLKLQINCLENPKDTKILGNQLSQINITNLNLQINYIFTVQAFLEFIQCLFPLVSLKNLTIKVSNITEVYDNDSDQEEGEKSEEEQNQQETIEKQQTLPQQFISDCQSFLSQLQEFNLTIEYYERNAVNQNLQIFEICKQLPSLKSLNTHLEQHLFDMDNYQKLNYVNFFDKCIYLKDLQLNLSMEDLENDVYLFKEIKKLHLLENLRIDLRLVDSLNQEQCLAFKESMENLKMLNQLSLKLKFQQSDDFLELKYLLEGLQFLQNLNMLNLYLTNKSLNSKSAQFFSSQMRSLHVKQKLYLQIANENEFFQDGTKYFCQSLENFKSLQKLSLNFQKENINCDQLRDIFQNLYLLQQIEDLQLDFPFVQIGISDVLIFRNCLKQLKQLDTLVIKLDSILGMHLLNLTEDLPFLTIFQNQFMKAKFKRKGLNRLKFNKMEEENKNNEDEKLVINPKPFLTQEFEINRIRLQLNSSIRAELEDLKWAVLSLKLPSCIELRVPYIYKNSQQEILQFLSLFKHFNHIRSITFKKGQKNVDILPKLQVSNIFYKIKYLVSFKYSSK